jgi:hypothetical protein
VKQKLRHSQLGIRNSRPASPSGRISSFEVRGSRFAFLLAVLLEVSCAAPGDPRPPRPVVPVAVTDLAAHQLGDGALLTFTPPSVSVEGEHLAELPAIEILRGFADAGAQSPPAGSLQIVYTVPGQVLDTYLVQNRIQFNDPLKAEEVSKHSGQRLFYVVRARVSKRAASVDSGAASFILHPAPTPIAGVRATVVEAGVQLTWDPPATVSGGATLTSLAGFRIYRAEARATPSPAPEAARESARPAQAEPEGPAVLAGISPSPAYLDSQMEWGKTYIYTVRTVAQYGADAVESADSRSVQVTPKDVFPPASPHDVVAVYVPAAGASPAAVELSWAISPEPDVAGYHVYRQGEGEEKAVRVNPVLLPTPAFRDISVVSGARYTYAISAVDRSGNESQPSAPVHVTIPKAGG